YDLAIAYLEGGAAYYVADHVKARKKAAFIHIDYGKAGYTRKLDRDCYLTYDRVFTVSDEVKDHFLKFYPECEERTKVFRNLINQEEIKRKAKEEGGFSDSFDGIRILTVGRLTYQKAYEIAIDVMKKLKEESFPVRWYVLGEGSEREKLEKQIAELGLQEDFLLMGAVQNPYPYYKQCDLYVHATRFEGKSIAIQEAQTLGCAIVASDCSGNREQIESGVDGILCDLDVDAIKDSICILILDENLRETFANVSQKKQIVHREDLEMLFELLVEK
ncbi:MAG: glycosyltransferase, partial [Lachnospiraceae bacterium]|nr:glycosyltransferase [Lachnospiraceae bacterium]